MERGGIDRLAEQLGQCERSTRPSRPSAITPCGGSRPGYVGRPGGHYVTAESNLEQAARHVKEAKRIIASQRALIAKLGDGGHDTQLAKDLLDQFERTLAIFEADLEVKLTSAKSN
jgi:hypothetical protein